MTHLDPSLTAFINSDVIPRYAAFDKAHQEDHALAVIDRALALADHYPVDRAVVYAAAACHDLGLSVDRKTHHLESGRIIRAMPELRRWFSEEQIETIAQAAEDHRASSDHEPRSIYGRIVAEADRLIEPEQIIRRTIQFGIAHYPDLPRERHWERTLEHLHEKYAEGGYLKLWIPESPNAARLAELRAVIRDEAALRAIYDRIYREETPAAKESPRKHIEVVAAIIRSGDRIFATQRGYGDFKDWWEFPGGKMEPGETPEAALVREIREELSTEIRIDKFLRTVEWDYPDFHLTLHCYFCSLLSEALHLNEHEAARWLAADELHSVRWLPADEDLLPLIRHELIHE